MIYLILITATALLFAFFGMQYFAYRCRQPGGFNSWYGRCYIQAIGVWHSPEEAPMRGHTILFENDSLVKYFCSGIGYYENWAFFKADWAVIRWAYTSDLEKLGSVK